MGASIASFAQPTHIDGVLGGASRNAPKTLEESFHMPMTAKKKKKTKKKAKKATKKRKAKKAKAKPAKKARRKKRRAKKVAAAPAM